LVGRVGKKCCIYCEFDPPKVLPESRMQQEGVCQHATLNPTENPCSNFVNELVSQGLAQATTNQPTKEVAAGCRIANAHGCLAATGTEQYWE